jgi:gamma-glutamylcysteine synthetase
MAVAQLPRNVWSKFKYLYDVALSPTTVDAGRSSYTVKARVNWIDSNGNVLKWGTEEDFYIPIRAKKSTATVSM